MSSEVVRETLLGMIVCSDESREKVAYFGRGQLCGTRNGWQLLRSKKGQPNNVPCHEKPETHKHWLFEC